jgi:serine/threonine protein kinase
VNWIARLFGQKDGKLLQKPPATTVLPSGQASSSPLQKAQSLPVQETAAEPDSAGYPEIVNDPAVLIRDISGRDQAKTHAVPARETEASSEEYSIDVNEILKKIMPALSLAQPTNTVMPSNQMDLSRQAKVEVVAKFLRSSLGVPQTPQLDATRQWAQIDDDIREAAGRILHLTPSRFTEYDLMLQELSRIRSAIEKNADLFGVPENQKESEKVRELDKILNVARSLASCRSATEDSMQIAFQLHEQLQKNTDYDFEKPRSDFGEKINGLAVRIVERSRKESRWDPNMLLDFAYVIADIRTGKEGPARDLKIDHSHEEEAKRILSAMLPAAILNKILSDRKLDRRLKFKEFEPGSSERAPQGPLPVATATLDVVEALRQNRDIWLRLFRAPEGPYELAYPLLRAGAALPARKSLVLTNEVSNAKRIVFRIAAGALPPEEPLPPGYFRPRQSLTWDANIHESKSTDLAAVAIEGIVPEYRLVNRTPIEILIGADGELRVTVGDRSTQENLTVNTTRLLPKKDTGHGDEALTSNCREWEEWMTEMFTSVLGNRFEVSRVLAEGGFGRIYIVADRNKNRECHLLKALKPELSADRSSREQFRREIDLWKSLKNHLNIVSLMDVHEVDGQTYAAMPWIFDSRVSNASTLSAHLKLGHTRGFATNWASDFCSGMLHLRACGLRAHLDIKPDNLFIMPPHRPLDHQNGTVDTRAGVLKIGDFGLAVRKEEALSNLGLRAIDSGTKTDGLSRQFSYAVAGGRRILGTLGYMAPEIFDGQIAWERSDIFSFGVVLWQILANTTNLPYRVRSGTTTLELASEVYQQQKDRCFPKPPGPLGGIVMRCLDPDPGARYSGFKELLAALQAVPPPSDVPLVRTISSDLLTARFPESFNAKVEDDGTIWLSTAADDQWAVIQPFRCAVEANDALRLEALNRMAERFKYFEQTWNRESTWAGLPALEVEGVWSVQPTEDWDEFRKQDTVFHAWAVARGKNVFVFHYGVSRREAGQHEWLLRKILAATMFR